MTFASYQCAKLHGNGPNSRRTWLARFEPDYFTVTLIATAAIGRDYQVGHDITRIEYTSRYSCCSPETAADTDALTSKLSPFG